MAWEKEISALSKELTLDNLDSSLLKLFEILEKNLSPEEFFEITDKEINHEEGSRIFSDKYPQISDLIKKHHEILLSSRLEKNEEKIEENKDREIETAIVLIGGKATRLRPLTYILPKPLFPLHGKTLTEHIIDILKKDGIKNIVLAVGDKGDLVKNYFAEGSKFGVNINYTVEKVPMGTAAPLYLINPRPKKPFLMINGDDLFEVDIKKMYSFFKKNNAQAVIALIPTDNPLIGGVMKTEGNKILSFCEKLTKEEAEQQLGKPPYWFNTGYYILSPEIFDYLPPQKDYTKMENDIFPELVKTGRIFGFKSKGKWYDPGTPKRYEEIIKKWKDI